MHHPVDPDPTDHPTTAPSPIYTCKLMNDTVLLVPMTFYMVGQYVFVAVFYNNASIANNTIPFGVIQSEFVKEITCVHVLVFFKIIFTHTRVHSFTQ